MIQRHEIHPETIQECLDLASEHEKELEAIIDKGILKYLNKSIKAPEYFVIQVSRFSIRAIKSVYEKYASAGWGVLLTSSLHPLGSSLELRIAW